MKKKIDVGGYTLDAEVNGVESANAGIVLVHGKHRGMNDTLISLLFEQLSKTHHVMRFNFSYFADGTEPDNVRSYTELKACTEHMRDRVLILIGKSYGSYISVKAAMEQADRIKKVICIGYPFNDADDNKKTSDQLPLLGNIEDKLVFISGSNDPWCRLGRFIKNLPKQAKFYMINGGDHSLRGRDDAVTRRNMAEMLRLVTEAINEVDKQLK
ncbi:hypothetical protein M1310_01140 [Candidatus Marsarchaeota archaeon]|nr:hypothetical protein [Candidatus Marsarchaeota archaeon]